MRGIEYKSSEINSVRDLFLFLKKQRGLTSTFIISGLPFERFHGLTVSIPNILSRSKKIIPRGNFIKSFQIFTCNTEQIYNNPDYKPIMIRRIEEDRLIRNLDEGTNKVKRLETDLEMFYTTHVTTLVQREKERQREGDKEDDKSDLPHL